jgi:hypothetical protein
MLAGCGMQSTPEPGKSVAISGMVHGGQAPVGGSAIQLYAAGTGGDGSAATPLIQTPVTTSDGSGNATNGNANAGNGFNSFPVGSFTITGDYACPSATTPVYLTTVGGNPGLEAGNNSALAMMAMLGACGNLSGSSFIDVDELTTVGSIVPLVGYMSSYAGLGAGAGDQPAFLAAVAAVNVYTNVANGTVPGPSLPAGNDGSSVAIQTLGGVVAACINSSGGVAGDGSICGQLFTLTTVPGQAAPLDTIGAVLNLVKNPALNVEGIFDLMPASPPYEPVLTGAPATWQFPILAEGAALSTSGLTPASNGYPIAMATLGYFEFVAVQGAGEILTYDFSSGSQMPVAAYVMPCNDPSGMVVAKVRGSDVLAAVCFDTNSLVTLSVNGDGSLSALGSVSGLPSPYPGIALDGANVLVPLFGQSFTSNGGVAKVSLADPANPVVTAAVTLVPSAAGTYANPGSLTVAGGYIYVCAGSESDPRTTSSSIQVVRESDMTLVGTPLIVDHSPQQIAIQGNVLYTTLYDVQEFESVNIASPANLRAIQTVSLSAQNCYDLPVVVRGTTAYVGCYTSGEILEVDVSDPANMQVGGTISGVSYAQQMEAVGPYLLSVGSNAGGGAYLTVGAW